MARFADAALLLMDFQVEIVDMLAGGGSASAVERAAAARAAARDARMPVIYVRVGFRAGYPEVNPVNKRFAAVRDAGRLQEASSGADIVAQLSPGDDEPIVTKRRVGAFTHTDLQPILSALGVRTLVLSGLSTSGVVLSTVRQASDADFDLVVLSDACADGDRELHEVLVNKLFPSQARVMGVDEFVGALKQG